MTETELLPRPDGAHPGSPGKAFAARIFDDTVHALELFGIYLGDRLGLYRALAEHGPLDAAGLAAAAGVAERYAAEWLDQQAIAGVLEVRAHPAGRRFALPEGHAGVLLDGQSLDHLAPLAAGVVALAQALPAVLGAFVSGDGVPYHRYGHDLRWCVGRLARPWFFHHLGTDVVPAMPDLDARLRADPPAWVADVGCGTGWSAIALALAYPKARVDAFDTDEASVAEARIHAAAYGVADRVAVHLADSAHPTRASLTSRPGPTPPPRAYDLACTFKAVHDLADPVAFLAALRDVVVPGGTVLVADGNVAERMRTPGIDRERFTSGWSLLHALPRGLAESPGARPRPRPRPESVHAYATAAGFADVEVVASPTDHWRCYRLTPGHGVPLAGSVTLSQLSNDPTPTRHYPLPGGSDDH